MTLYAGLDVSDKSTHVCVVEPSGSVAWRGTGAMHSSSALPAGW